MTGAYPGSPAKRLKTFVPPDIETISDPVISRFITKLDNLDLDSLMKEAREAHLLTANIKTYLDDAMTQTTSTTYTFGSVSTTLTHILTPRVGGRIYSTHHALNMGDQNIGFLQQTLTGLCNVVGTLEQKMHYLSPYEASQSIKDSSTIAPRDEFYVQILTLAADLDGV